MHCILFPTPGCADTAVTWLMATAVFSEMVLVYEGRMKLRTTVTRVMTTSTVAIDDSCGKPWSMARILN